ncbi:MAG: hypothetical protein J1F12_04160 [Muribaculaceae bacterium]|nr:hypothetical protein [Muribaculaceae bacterium]
MIPKTIHFMWFSGSEYPPFIKKCIDSWHKVMPEYEYRLWDMNAIKDIDSAFLKEALECKKWAFASDFTRLYALYNYGGIYLDTDVEVYKKFNALLNHKAFIGRENSHHVAHKIMISHLTSHCMGAKEGHPFIKACLDYYEGRHFIQSQQNWLPDNLKYDQTTLPFIQTEIATLQGYRPARKYHGIQVFGDDVHVYPYSYFDCHHRKKETYCKHFAMGSWRSRGNKIQDSKIYSEGRLRGADMLFNLSSRLGFMIVKDDKRDLSR